MGSIAIIDEQKILFPVVPNTTGFARETNPHHGHVANL